MSKPYKPFCMDKCPQPLCPPYVEMVTRVNQAIFFCYNESSQRLPVGIVGDFVFTNDKTLSFKVNFFPMTEKLWDAFDGELFVFKKGFAYSVILHGIAVVSDREECLIQFNIDRADYFMQSGSDEPGLLSNLFKPYIDFYRRGSELVSSTFNRKMLSTALHRLTMHSDN